MLFFALSHFSLDDGHGFVFFWVLVVVGTILANFYNAFSERGVTEKIVEAHDPAQPALATPPDAAARLRRLDDLRRQHLLTASEYEQRRADLVRQL